MSHQSVVPKWVPAGLRADYLDARRLYGDEGAASIVRKLKAEAGGDDGKAASVPRGERLSAIVSMYRAGQTPLAISHALGLTYSSVDGSLKRARAAGLLPYVGRSA